MRALPDDITHLLRAGRGVFSAREAAVRAITKDRLRRLTRSGLLVRLADGVYGESSGYEVADTWSGFTLRSRAFTLACGPAAAAGGWSAAAVLGLPAINAPPEQPLALVPVGSGVDSNNRAGRVRAVSFATEHRSYANGCRVTSAARTVVDVARTAPRADALVIADAALSTVTTAAELQAVLAFEAGWRGIGAAAWVVAHADGRAESPLETLGRLTFVEHGLPLPISNAWIDTARGRYRVDHLLPDRWLVFEGDGSLKYDNRLDAGRVVADQREREWLLRELGLEVVRYGWELARYDRNELAARFGTAIERCPVRGEPFPWSWV